DALTWADAGTLTLHLSVDLTWRSRRGGGTDLGHDLLGEDVERGDGGLERVERALAHGGEQGGALDQLVAGEGEQPALGHAVAAVVGPADPLEERGDATRRADLADELDRADVDAELEGGG